MVEGLMCSSFSRTSGASWISPCCSRMGISSGRKGASRLEQTWSVTSHTACRGWATAGPYLRRRRLGAGRRALRCRSRRIAAFR
jgi:hypothetical protein